jgi:chemotaxis protein MotB
VAQRVRRRGGNGLDAWPGYVDALSTLLMVIIFVLMVFVLSQAFLTAALSGRNQELEKAQQQLTSLADELSLQRTKAGDLQLAVSQLGKQLSERTDQRDKLSAQLSGAKDQLAEMKRQIAELDKTVAVDKETLQVKLADLAKLENQTQALAALRDELEKKAEDATARALTERERRQAVQLQLSDEQKLSDSTRAQIALLNQQIGQLKNQLLAIAANLDLSETQNKDKDTQIANLGQKLNVALAAKVEELQQYRSEFFGKLRRLLANRPGIAVVGDRFVFQSEVLFPVGSADLTPAGEAQMTTLAATIKDIASEIPPEVNWILRVDGHTDPQPVKSGSFPSNWELSAERAIEVVRLLIAHGVPADHLAATAFGEYQPFAPGDTPDAYAKDRRIELRLTDR